MTDYDDKEVSLVDSSPYELYKFVGTYKSYYMTPSFNPISFLGNTYLPAIGLKRNERKLATHDEPKELTVDIPIKLQIAKDYAFQATPPSLELTVYRLQRDATTYVVYWKGDVLAFTINGKMAKAKIPTKFSSLLAGEIPSVYIQAPCNNALFDQLCKVVRLDNSLDTVVATVIDDRTITIPSLGGFPDGWFIGGEVAIPSRNERRTIIAQDDTEITMNYSFSTLVAGTSIQLASGCDHSYDGVNGCPKYENRRNFGGAPFVPGETNNIFESGIE